MVESHGYETKKSFVNLTCYFRFIKCLVVLMCRLLQIILQKHGNSIYPIRFISFQIIFMPRISKCI